MLRLPLNKFYGNTNSKMCKHSSGTKAKIFASEVCWLIHRDSFACWALRSAAAGGVLALLLCLPAGGVCPHRDAPLPPAAHFLRPSRGEHSPSMPQGVHISMTLWNRGSGSAGYHTIQRDLLCCMYLDMATYVRSENCKQLTQSMLSY